jgi:GNAT superfamily N-acetyltransferase
MRAETNNPMMSEQGGDPSRFERLLRESGLEGSLDTDKAGDSVLDLRLPQGSVSAILWSSETDRRVADMGNLVVNEADRGQGFGEALMRQLARELVGRGVTDLRSVYVNPVALRMAQRVFGAGNMNYYHEDSVRQVSLPMTNEQAFATLDRLAPLEDPSKAIRQQGVGVHVDLRQIVVNESEESQ